MPRRFPKIGESNTYPYLDNAKPFDRKVTFDYSRYDYTATAKLCKVTWPSDYRHTVYWASAQERDAWFDALDGYAVELSHGTLHTQTDSIQLDVPYDVALTFNYVYMKVPQTTENQPIDHENDGGIRTVGAFIDACEYLAPSTTLFRLSVDIWSTYMPYTSVRGMMLDRGHAPMWALSASDYLANPIGLCANLLTPDVSFGEAGIVRGGEFAPLSMADPIYVLASTIPYGRINGITKATNQGTTAPTYYDTGARNGEQVGVSGYLWGGGKSYEGMTNPSTPTHADGSLPTGLYYYGIMGSAVASGALSTLFTALPVLATSCQAAFVVPSDLVRLGTTHMLEGVTVYEVANRGLTSVATFDVGKDLFGYPERYADIAKLYTEPYAHIEISDDLGNSATIAIEDTGGTIDVSQMISIAFPALEWRAAVTNVANTGGNVRYSWAELDGSEKSKVITNADFAQTFMDFGIPTYALYLEARTEQALRTWTDGQQQRANALVAYQSTMRSANTGEQNAYASNATAKANADASADTNVANVARSGNNSTANTNIANNLRTTITGLNQGASYDIQETQAQNIFDNGEQDDEYTQLATDINLKSEAIAATSNMAGSAAMGNALGVLQAGISGIVNITTSQSLADLSSSKIIAKESINQALVRDTAGRQRTLMGDTTVTQNNAATNTNTNNVNTANANAQASMNTTKANASRSQATGNSNANYSRDTTEENAKQALENARAGYQRSLDAAGIEAPNAHGSYGGSSVHEIWENRGIHLRGVTQTQGAIKQAGDTFLRYGYMLGAAWNMGEWVPSGRTYCYWQSTDIWQDIADVDNTEAERMLEAILAAGVTVWDKPEHVGRFEAS